MTLKLQLNRLKSLALINKRGLAFLCMMPAIVLASLFLAPLVSSLEVISPTVTQSLLNHPDQTDIDIPVQIQVSVPFQLDQSSQQFSIFAFTNQPPEAITSIAFYVRTTDATETLPCNCICLALTRTVRMVGLSLLMLKNCPSWILVALWRWPRCQILKLCGLNQHLFTRRRRLFGYPRTQYSGSGICSSSCIALADDDSAALLAVSQETVPPHRKQLTPSAFDRGSCDGISGLWTKGFWDSLISQMFCERYL